MVMIVELNIAPGPDLGRGNGRAPGAGLRPEASAPAIGSDIPTRAPQAKVEHPEAQRIKALLSDPSKRVSTHHDDASGHMVLRVEDRATGELVEQIPSDKLLRLYAAMRETLFDQRA